MASTTVTNVAAAIDTILPRVLQPMVEDYLVVSKYAQTEPIQKGEGDRYYLTRLLRPAMVTSTTSAGTMLAGSDSSVKSLVANRKEVTPQIITDAYGFEDTVDILSWLKNPDFLKAIAQSWAASMDRYYLRNILSIEGTRFRNDWDPTYQFTGTASGGTTSTLIAAALSGADDLYNNWTLGVTGVSSQNYGIAKRITDFVASTDTATIAFPQAPDSTTKFLVTGNTNLASSSVITTTSIAKLIAQAEQLHVPAYSAQAKLVGFLHSLQKLDLIQDSVWQDTATAHMGGNFKNYEVNRWYDCEFVLSTHLRREDTSAAASDTGALFVSPFLGGGAFKMMPWGHGSGAFGAKLHVVDQPDSYNLHSGKRFLTWKSYAAGIVPNCNFAPTLITGATTSGLELLTH